MPTSQVINIAFIAGPNGVALMAATPAQGVLAFGQGSFDNNEDPDPNAPGFIDKIKNWLKGVGESARNYIANFKAEDLSKVRPVDREALRGNPNDIIRARHNTTPEDADAIMKDGKIGKSGDGKVYVESPDAPNVNGVVKQDPRVKADELGILPDKGNAGVDFFIRRGDLKLERNPRTGNMDLVVEGDVQLQYRSPESFVRQE